jgi:uncharacterized protein with von Willebrand factor type A (vWA) domain
MGAADTTSPERLAVGFARVLRGAGIPVPVGSVLAFTEALDAIGLNERRHVYWAARATLVRRPEDLALFDRAFAAFWDQLQPDGTPPPAEQLQVTLALDDGNDSDEGDDAQGAPEDDPTVTLRFSAVEVLRHKDFSQYTDEELEEAQRLMGRLRVAGPPRRSFRLQPTRRAGTRPDLRRTVRAALAAGGEPIRRHRREPGDRLRRLVLLLDVSGSMEPYARALLRFVHAAVAGRQRVEAFALGTRLTRMTRELGSRDPDQAISRAAASVVDWSGGTRLGEGLRRFNDDWGVRGMARGAIVVILSDGWDRGEPELLAEQMARLARIAERIIWVNPLKVTPGYAPLARGMAAALPYVDDFVEGHSIAALEELARVIAQAGTEERR